jgi:hypothetical protein
MEDVGILKAIWSILLPFGIFCFHWIYVMVIWYYIFPRFGMLYQEKSGNPAHFSQLGLDWILLERHFYFLSRFLFYYYFIFIS